METRREFLRLSAAAAAALAGQAGGAAEEYFPPPESRGGWRLLAGADAVRAAAGLDPDRLAELERWLLASDTRDFAAVVIRRGHVALQVERNRRAGDAVGNVKSCAKAICATVLAIAAEESAAGRTPVRMRFSDPAFRFIPAAHPLSDPRKEAVTVGQLLNHTSGITPEATGVPNQGPWEKILGHADEPRTRALAFDPGADLGYSTHALYHASLVCEHVTGMPYDRFAIAKLFRPLGIEKWWFEQIAGDEKHGSHPSHALGICARDLARVAFCMLRGGKWEGRQVIPSWFVEETAAPTHAVRGPRSFGREAASFSHGWELPGLLGGERGASIPADARFKPGSGGQLMAFVPSLDLVVARQTGGSGQWEYEEYLRRACRAVLPA